MVGSSGKQNLDTAGHLPKETALNVTLVLNFLTPSYKLLLPLGQASPATHPQRILKSVKLTVNTNKTPTSKHTATAT